ncbi:3'-5' exonuclease [Pseudovibrio sp. POLY-S9]|uniref:3'-5' exonuclease n=1 Tax=Pseudovibrio sp. POLY-S9 TaxID=1576596 RepID=UPI00070EC768|nr:3'-5' exonuclease [Pseudovibrio sp. POLY-S9]
MRIRAIDFETTGWMEDPKAEICEIGHTDLIRVREPSLFVMDTTFTNLVNPGYPIPEAAQQVHGITDEMVRLSVTPASAKHYLRSGMAHDSIYTAHYADFEQHFFKAPDFQWICTWRCAKILYPESPRHKLSTLAGHLKLKEREGYKPELATPLHRAGPDSYLCALLVERMLEDRELTELLEISKRPAETFPRSKEATQ